MKTISLLKPPQSAFLKAAKVLLSPGEEIGEHMNDNREEIIIIMKGEGVLLNGSEHTPIKQGCIYHVKQNTRHNVKNTSGEELEYVYVVSLSNL